MQIKLFILLITLQQANSLCMSCLFSRNKPVCGNDGQTYDNECEAVCQGIVVVSQGQCVVQNDPNICVCSKEENWVCGQDGNNYKNLCLMKCSGVELASEGLCEDRTQICNQGCNNSAVSVEMLLSQTIAGSNTVPNFCTAFCSDNININLVISVAGIANNYDYIAEQDSNNQYCQELPQIECEQCDANQFRCSQCQNCVENGNTERAGCLNNCRTCTNCQFENRCINDSARSTCFREVKRDSQQILSLAQCGCPDFNNPQCGQNQTTQYRNTCHLLCNFDRSSGSICPGGNGDTTGEICPVNNGQNNNNNNNGQNNNNNGQNNNNNGQNNNNNGQNNNNNGQNNNNNGQNNQNIIGFQQWLQNQYLQNRNQYLGITLSQNG